MRIAPLLAALVLAASPPAAAAGTGGAPTPAPAPAPAPAAEETDSLFTRDHEWTFPSRHLGGELVVLPGVFGPYEAEWEILPFLERHARLFEGRSVLEIGTGSGAVAVYAAKLGARRVVATDIHPNAVASARRNAERFGVAGVVEARLVPPDDVSAYAVVGEDEVFDVIVSNPPFSLDLDASHNNAVTDTGDLGFSIVDGLDRHLARPDGVALLYYGSLFYHLVMVKYARHAGFEVRSHRPVLMTEWEASVLFNAYLRRLLAARGLPPDAFGFSREDETLHIRLVPRKGEPPLVDGPGARDAPSAAGWMAIRHSGASP